MNQKSLKLIISDIACYVSTILNIRPYPGTNLIWFSQCRAYQYEEDQDVNVRMAGFIICLPEGNRLEPDNSLGRVLTLTSFIGQNLGNQKDAKNKISNIWMIMCRKEQEGFNVNSRAEITDVTKAVYNGRQTFLMEIIRR